MGAVNSTYQHVKHALHQDHDKSKQKNRGSSSQITATKPPAIDGGENSQESGLELESKVSFQRRSAITSCYTLALENEEEQAHFKNKSSENGLLHVDGNWEESSGQFIQANDSVEEDHVYKESSGTFYDSDTKTKKNNTSSTEHDNSKFEVIGLYSYIARTEEELSFNEGDKLEVLDGGEKDWWKAKLLEPPYTVGHIPHTFVAKPESLESKPWYFFHTSRVEAERYLMCSRNEHASFLIRACKNPDAKYALSVRDHDRVRHYLIHGNEIDGVFISTKAKFPNVIQLIEHHQMNKCRHLSRLGPPCIKLEVPQTVGLTYELTDKWEIDRSRLGLKQKLGRGNFGEVFEGLWNGVTKVAVKTLKQGGLHQSEFLKEAENMKKLIHPKVVQLYGVCTDRDPYYIVTELMCNGDLLTFLLKGKGHFLTVPKLIDITSQIACGMAFLESRKFVHRDLAARNILVGEENICKVADFGLARLTQDDMYITTKKDVKLPVKWTAPEALKLKEFTTKSDVWSFGIVLVEVIEKGMTPYPAMNNSEVYTQVNAGYRMPQSLMPNCPDKLYQLMVKCWDQTPADRPTFAMLTKHLENFYNIDGDESNSNLLSAGSDLEYDA